MPIEAQSYVALEPLAILLLKEDRLVASMNLRLANDPRILLDVLLDPLLPLLVDAAVGEQCDGLVALELEEHVRVRNEEHLVDLVQLLEAHDVDFAAAGRRLDHEAELLVVPLALRDHVSRHGHPLDGLNRPLLVLIITFITVAVLILIFIIAAIIAISFTYTRRIDFTETRILSIAMGLDFLFLPEEVLGHGHVNAELVLQVVG